MYTNFGLTKVMFIANFVVSSEIYASTELSYHGFHSLIFKVTFGFLVKFETTKTSFSKLLFSVFTT